MLEDQNNTWYYKISYFFISNQIIFKRLAIVLLILLNLGIWIFGGIKIGNYIINSVDHKQTLKNFTSNYIDWVSLQKKDKPLPIKILSTNIIENKNNKYDFVAKVNNPNSNWKIDEVRFSFVVDGYMIDEKTEFILPGKNKYLTSFSYSSNSKPNNVELKINNIKWKKIKTDGLNKLNIIDNIIISNKEFDANTNIAQLKFSAFNNTHYNFWQIGWQIALYRNDVLYAFNYLTSDTFLSGDKRNVSATWLEPIKFPTKIEVIPDIDIFNSTNYIIETDKPTVNLIKGARTKR